MPGYLLRNDNVQHEHRKMLVTYYQNKRGRPVPFAEILHDLMAEKVAKLKLLPTP